GKDPPRPLRPLRFNSRNSTMTTIAGPEVVPRNRRPYGSVLETIGWTPLIRLNRVTRGTRTPVYGKADFFNPGGSVKDRIGMPIIERAEREGKLRPGEIGRASCRERVCLVV